MEGIRKPVVSGQFYSSDTLQLKRQISSFVDEKSEKREIISCILPHAGYMYSGAVCGATVSRFIIKDTIIILGPNHTGYGENFSIMTEGSWQTPLGEVQIDSELAKIILKNSKYLKEDSLAHRYEHSIEVELPFLQYFKSDFKIVPIVISVGDLEIYKRIGKDIAESIKSLKREKDTIIIASSDMSHYEPEKIARDKDHKAIEAILKLDEEKLWNVTRNLDISMCGVYPAICMLSASKELGAKSSELVKYQTSGDVTGDFSSVVGYAGIIIY
jgi:AmmeMemoRadiSam system protein B